MGTTTSGDEDIALSYKWKMDPASRKWSRDDSAISSFAKSSKSQIVKRSCSTPVTYKQRNFFETPSHRLKQRSLALIGSSKTSKDQSSSKRNGIRAIPNPILIYPLQGIVLKKLFTQICLIGSRWTSPDGIPKGLLNILKRNITNVNWFSSIERKPKLKPKPKSFLNKSFNRFRSNSQRDTNRIPAARYCYTQLLVYNSCNC